MILTKKYKGKYWSLEGDGYEGLTWLSEGNPPLESELESLWPEVQYEIAYEMVQVDRSEEYRKTSDPIFFQYQRGEATEQEWLEAVQSIKNMYPYPEKTF